jgi:hypothetical protein
MQHIKSFAFAALVLFAPAVHAQEPLPPPATPAPEAAPVVPETPKPAPEFPPAPPKPPKKPPVVVEEVPAASTGVGMEVATSGFASGALDGGLLFGVHISNGSLLGVRFAYSDKTLTVGSMSRSTNSLTVGLAARFPVVGSKRGLDMAVALDLDYLKDETDAGADPDMQPAVGATGFRIGIGPQLRYWINPSVAVGYMVQAEHKSQTADQKGPDGEAIEGSETALVGKFTVTAGF